MKRALEGTGLPFTFDELQHGALVLLDTFALPMDLRVGDGWSGRLRSIAGAGRERRKAERGTPRQKLGNPQAALLHREAQLRNYESICSVADRPFP
jgi:hypothetical protein